MVVIEHNLDVIKTADWIIDLGPEGGDGGGEIVAVGSPIEVAANKRSHTGHYLKPLLERHSKADAKLTGSKDKKRTNEKIAVTS